MPRPLLALVLATAFPAAAQDFSAEGALRRLELPAHERLMMVIAAPGTELAPFATDGCSGGMSASWSMAASLFPGLTVASTPLWEECCVTHDHAYHNAGQALSAAQSFEARLAADTALQRCVGATGESNLALLSTRYSMTPAEVRDGFAVIAQAMFGAVRLGGAPCSGLPWRWGYGYPNCGW